MWNKSGIFYSALFVDCVEEVYYAWATTSPSYKLQITSKIDQNFWQKAKLYQKAKKTKSITYKNGKIGKKTDNMENITLCKSQSYNLLDRFLVPWFVTLIREAFT